MAQAREELDPWAVLYIRRDEYAKLLRDALHRRIYLAVAIGSIGGNAKRLADNNCDGLSQIEFLHAAEGYGKDRTVRFEHKVPNAALKQLQFTFSGSQGPLGEQAEHGSHLQHLQGFLQNVFAEPSRPAFKRDHHVKAVDEPCLPSLVQSLHWADKVKTRLRRECQHQQEGIDPTQVIRNHDIVAGGDVLFPDYSHPEQHTRSKPEKSPK